MFLPHSYRCRILILLFFVKDICCHVGDATGGTGDIIRTDLATILTGPDLDESSGIFLKYFGLCCEGLLSRVNRTRNGWRG